jgi:hypothetical protein
MRYSTFEQAAAEASAGVQEIDAEIQQLTAKRELLQTLAHQLLAVLPALAEAAPANGGNNGGRLLDNPAAEHPSWANGAADDHSYSSGNEESPAWSSADGAPSPAGTAPEAEAPAAEQPAFAELLSQNKPYSLRNEGWPSSSAVDQRGLRRLL